MKNLIGFQPDSVPSEFVISRLRLLISRTALCFAFSIVSLAIANCGLATPQEIEFRAMTWNIWHGGREDGGEIGPQRVIETIRNSKADIVAMQETYGSGEKISKELGFHFHPPVQTEKTNVSILSRFPILEDISVHEEFKCVGALIELPNKQRIAFYSIWLPYAAEIWEEGTRPPGEVQTWLKACAPSEVDLLAIRKKIAAKLDEPRFANVPVIIAGDFNSMSHLDYTSVAQADFREVIDWPTSHVLTDAGFRDSYRDLHPTIDRNKDRTWSPRFPKQEQDRIDFIYHRGDQLKAIDSSVVDQHVEKFPSDHAAVVTTFRLTPSDIPADDAKQRTLPMKVLSYNIKHCRGMDDVVNLDRTEKTISEFDADVVALQEVDLDCERSGTVNQPRELGKKLQMFSAFGRFMELQGGKYGLAILSRYPLYRVQELSLPKGNEPRVALVATARLPDGQEFLIINVHFDWVDDDRFRFEQAGKVRAFLDQQELPCILMGDFNDSPGSRTLKLFESDLLEAKKPTEDQFTFSSTKPELEIDFIFAAPVPAWRVKNVKVAHEPMTSDHRPLFSELELVR